MTGAEFRAIRRHNKIRQTDVAYELGYAHPFVVQQAENTEHMPLVFVKVLSQILGVDFTKPENVQNTVAEIPDKYFKRIVINRKPKNVINVFKPPKEILQK